jgi:hypothetical protein
MAQADWDRFEALVMGLQAGGGTETLARAHGEVLSRLLEAVEHAPPAPGPLDWMDWERQKTLRLLRVPSELDVDSHTPPAPGPLDWMDWERRKALRLLRERSAM